MNYTRPRLRPFPSMKKRESVLKVRLCSACLFFFVWAYQVVLRHPKDLIWSNPHRLSEQHDVPCWRRRLAACNSSRNESRLSSAEVNAALSSSSSCRVDSLCRSASCNWHISCCSRASRSALCHISTTILHRSNIIQTCSFSTSIPVPVGPTSVSSHSPSTSHVYSFIHSFIHSFWIRQHGP